MFNWNRLHSFPLIPLEQTKPTTSPLPNPSPNKKPNKIHVMDWWAMNLPGASAQGVQGWVASWWHSDALRPKHLDDKTQSPRRVPTAFPRHKFCWRQLTFYTHWFLFSISEVSGKRVGGNALGIIRLSLPAAPFTYSRRGANYNLYLPDCHFQVPPLTAAHWYTNQWLKRRPPIFSLPFIKKKKRYDSMLMILSFFAFMRIQIKWEAMWWLSSPAFDSSFSIYPSKHCKTSSVMSCSSLPSIKTPAVTASSASYTRACLLYSGLMCGW